MNYEVDGAVLSAYGNGDINKLIRFEHKRLEKGDLRALFVLGAMYEIQGKSDPSNFGKAYYYYSRSTEEVGTLGAWFGLARLYYLGTGVEQDFEEAFKCYWVLVEDADHPLAKLMLGRMYFEGRGVSKDLVLARRYLSQAAESEYVFAYTFLGHIDWELGKYLSAVANFSRAVILNIKIRKTDPRARMI